MWNRFLLKKEVFIATTSLFGWIALGTILFHRLEPWTWIQAFYFSVVTITTVGYGDLAPSGDLSRLFAAIYILTGVSIGIVTLTIVGTELLKYREVRYMRNLDKKNQRKENKNH